MKKFTLLIATMLFVIGAAQTQIVDDFEHIKLNVMLGGEDDDSQMTVIPNPDPEGGNPSSFLVKFERSQHGVPWGGFWSLLPEPLDLTEHKYVYVKVWKPRISPLKFKIEGGDTPNLEIESMKPQMLTEEWEEIVFDFSEKTGTWNVIAFMPDFEDPLQLDDDIIIYFDDIRTGEHPNVGVPDLTQSNQLTVFPNPVNDYITIKNKEVIQDIEIYDLAGKLVYRTQVQSAETRLNVSDLSHGVYILKATAGNKHYYHKINR